MAQNTVELVLKAVDENVSKTVKAVDDKLNDLEATTAKTGNGITGMTGKISGIVTKFGGYALAVGGVVATYSKLTEGYKEAERAEARLVQLTTSITGATQAQNDALIQLADQYEKVGVVAGDVTVAGMSQLASWGLNTKEIEQLTPALTDLIVATKGVNGTQGDAIASADKFGKVLNGQLGALSDAGILFTEAQGEILKTGDRTEKLATLTEILNANYGGLNTALAETSEGGFARLMNAMGRLIDMIMGPIVEAVNIVSQVVADWIFAFTDYITGAGETTDSTFGKIKETIVNTLTTIGEIIRPLLEAISLVWSQHGEIITKFVSQMMESVVTTLKVAFEVIGPIVTGALEGIATAFKVSFEVIGGAIKVVSSALDGDFGGAMQAMKTTVSSVLESVKGYFDSALEKIKGVINKIIELVNKIPAINIPTIGGDKPVTTTSAGKALSTATAGGVSQRIVSGGTAKATTTKTENTTNNNVSMNVTVKNEANIDDIAKKLQASLVRQLNAA